ncbi:MAG: response regulator transcription factor [Acidobacteria bacterium]|nr:response regulator transcription factor [Acidobacteriota bacterium]
MSKRIILVIEDDAAIRSGIVDALTFSGYKTHEAADGKAGMTEALQSACDLILLDLVLPKIGGLTILEELRKSRPALPVIILTARGEESDRVKGLELGADDYVVKPFSVKELLARVQAVLRRTPERPLDLSSIPFFGGTLDMDRCEVRFDDGRRGELSEREMELLRYLAINPKRAVSRDEIMERIWRINPRSVVETRTIDMHIARLREKLRDDPANPRIILTVRGKGYRFAGLEEASSDTVGTSGSPLD